MMANTVARDLIRVKQQILKDTGYYTLVVDGEEGPGTHDAVRRCKVIHGFNDNHSIGPKTDSLISAANIGAIKRWRDVAPPPHIDIGARTPPLLAEAMRHLGAREVKGPGSNPTIIQWAIDTGLQHYTNDDIPWCGLFAAAVVRAIYPDIPFTPNPLGARNWGGRDVISGGSHPGWGLRGPVDDLPLGGIGILWRTHKTRSWHGHIGFIFAQNDTHFGFIGGNQNDSVNRTWYPRSALLGTRVPPGANLPSAPRMLTGTTGGRMT